VRAFTKTSSPTARFTAAIFVQRRSGVARAVLEVDARRPPGLADGGDERRDARRVVRVPASTSTLSGTRITRAIAATAGTSASGGSAFPSGCRGAHATPALVVAIAVAPAVLDEPRARRLPCVRQDEQLARGVQAAKASDVIDMMSSYRTRGDEAGGFRTSSAARAEQRGRGTRAT
jgi:hypothetical protein